MLFAALGMISAIFVGDLLIKNKIEKTVQEDETKEKLGGLLLIRRHHNRGAFMNLGEKSGGSKVVAAISAALCLILIPLSILCLKKSGNRLLCTGLALLLGGAFSNTYDRLKRRYVVDYVSFGVPWPWLRRIVFNISDFCIIIGALLAAAGYIGLEET